MNHWEFLLKLFWTIVGVGLLLYFGFQKKEVVDLFSEALKVFH